MQDYESLCVAIMNYDLCLCG